MLGRMRDERTGEPSKRIRLLALLLALLVAGPAVVLALWRGLQELLGAVV